MGSDAQQYPAEQKIEDKKNTQAETTSHSLQEDAYGALFERMKKSGKSTQKAGASEINSETPLSKGESSQGGELGGMNKLEKGEAQQFGKPAEDFRHIKHLEPTKEERQDARDKALQHLEKNPLHKLLPEADRKLSTSMQDAILGGDMKELGTAVKGMQGDPERLKAHSEQVQKNLQELGAPTNLDVTKDGRVLAYSKFANHAVEVGKDGSAKIRAIDYNADGSVDVATNREPLRPTAEVLGKQIGNAAVLGIVTPEKPSFELLKGASNKIPNISDWTHKEVHGSGEMESGGKGRGDGAVNKKKAN